MGKVTEKFIGESQMKEVPKKKIGLVIRDGSVGEDKLADSAVTTSKIADSSITNNKISDASVSWEKLDHSLQNIIVSQETGELALATDWGTSEVLGITQKKLSEAHSDLQNQINSIIASSADVSFTISPEVIFTEEETAVDFVATCGTNASSIQIKSNTEIIVEGSGTVLSTSEDLIYEYSGTHTFTADFTILGLVKSVSKTVTAVDRIYYGIGSSSISDYSTFVEDCSIQSARTTPNGSYTYTPTNSLPYIYILVPQDLPSINLANVKLNNFGYNLTLISSDTTINGKSYKVYRSTGDNQSVTFTITVNN